MHQVVRSVFCMEAQEAHSTKLCSTVMLVVKSSESSLNKNTKEMQRTVEALIGTPGKFTMNNRGQYPGKL